MERDSAALLLKDREQVADRLLAASAKHSHDPDTELDWDAPLTAGLWFLPERLVSLYDTPLWQRMSEEQRIELSRHEAASLASAGVWFEVILMQLLTRHIYDLDPRSSHVTYALTEMADECRHSRMFARMVTKLGTPYYRPGNVTRFLGRVLKTTATTPGAFTATLLVEEARHVRYAREELRRQMANCPAWERQFTRTVSGEASVVVARALISPAVYASVGLDVPTAVRQARESEHRRETMRWSAEKLTEFLEETGIIHSALDRAAWRRSGLLAR